MNTLVNYAMQFVGVPYKYGGRHPSEGLDCSEYVQILLRFGGIHITGDLTAKGLYALFSHAPCSPQTGALAFYGAPSAITHVAFCVDSFRILEAGGGHTDTLSLQKAIEAKAFVRGSTIDRRNDLVAVVMPEYPLLTEAMK